jgi:hypothetical protein
MMDFLSLAFKGARYILESGLFWKLLLFWIVLRIARVVTRAHLSKDASFDVTDMIRNHSLPGKPIDVMLTFYATGALVTTVIYAIACTRPSASIQDINIFTVTYGGLWVLSDLGRKVAGRPQAPVLPNPPSAPTVTVNNQAQTTPDGTGNS